MELEREQAALQTNESYGAALRRPAVVLLSAQYLLWSIGIYGFVLWLPSIVKSGSHLSFIATGWLTAIPYLFGAIAMVIVSAYADRTLDRKGVTWKSLVIAGAAMYAPYGPFFAIIPGMLPRDAAGPAVALINSCGALGGFVGTYLVGWLDAATGSPHVSYAVLAASLFAAAALTFVARVEPHAVRPSPVPHA